MFAEASTPKRAVRGNPREGESERSLDSDQEEKYNDIIELLMVGGYFRARIAGLSRFDKVVGGLAWCITAANEDLDIDVFFQEEASMGQRIKLGENIIRALKRMNCPYRLESHQIQGGANTSDFVNIFPIIQWLVKKVIEVREETGDLMRLYSESQFNKDYHLPEDLRFQQSKTEAIGFLSQVNERYRTSRKLKKRGRRVHYLNQRTEEEQIQMALMEYGEFYRPTKVSSESKSQVAKDLEKSLGGKKAEDQNAEAQRREAELKKDMEEYVAGKLDKNALESLLPTNLSELENQYAYNQENDGSEQAQKKFGLKMHEQNVHKLEKEITIQQSEIATLKVKYDEISKQLDEVQATFNQKLKFSQRIVEEIAKLDAQETPENTQILQALKALVTLNENLKNQENAFKANCKRQLADLEEQIAQLKQQIEDRKKETADDELSQTLNQDSEKLKKVRQLTAKRNRDIALVERKIDEIPARTELTQYQRMFVELYEQVGSKLVETRRYYNTYNTLEDHRSFLEKEISIINSIHDNFKTAMASKANREKFLESIQTIIKSVTQNVEKMEKKLNDEKERKNQLTDQHSQLIEKERLYFKATKEFLEECKKNELLQQKLQEQQS